jgi:hypothetical protein
MGRLDRALADDLPPSCAIAVLGVIGTSIGPLYPVTTVSIQNAVTHHQVGIDMGSLNFFRLLASAFVFRWVFLAAWLFLATSFIALRVMEERPPRATPASVAPADPPLAR